MSISADLPDPDRVPDGVAATRDIAALLAWIEHAQDRSFAWRFGRDCVSFALGAVQAQTGVDLLADIPLWSTRAEALKVARSLGGLTAAIDARMERVPAAMARRGDVAALPDKAFGVRLMLVEGATLVAPSDHGLDRTLRSAMAWAWDAVSAHRVAVGQAPGPKAGGTRR